MKRVPDRFPTEVRQENRRVLGVTPNLAGASLERPWRYLPNKGLKGMAGAKKVRLQ